MLLCQNQSKSLQPGSTSSRRLTVLVLEWHVQLAHLSDTFGWSHTFGSVCYNWKSEPEHIFLSLKKGNTKTYPFVWRPSCQYRRFTASVFVFVCFVGYVPYWHYAKHVFTFILCVYDLTFYWVVEGTHPLSTELHEGRLPSQWAQFQTMYEPL